MKKSNLLKFSFLLGVAASLLLLAPVFSFAEVKGNILDWQMESYERTKEEFAYVLEDNLEIKGDIRGKSSEEIYEWQLKPFEWSQNNHGLSY